MSPAEGVVVTEIRPTRQGRFSLFSDGEFLLSTDAETLARFHVEEDTTMRPEELEELRANSDTRRAKDKALQYISLRDYGEQELYRKLCLRFDERTAAAAVAEMKRLELLNDAQFARRRAAWMLQNGKSRRETERTLCELGLARELVEQALEEQPDTEAENLDRLICKSYLSKLRAGRRDAVIAALVRRGFAINDIREALDRLVRDAPGEDLE